MRSKFELPYLSEAQTKKSTAIHIHSSVCRDAKALRPVTLAAYGPS